jgi:hypothetical protein
MMKKITLILFLVISLYQLPAFSQYRLSGIEAGITPGFSFAAFGNDSLVFAKRRNKITVVQSVKGYSLFRFSDPGRKITIYAGAGVYGKAFYMNKYNFGETFVALLTLGFGFQADTFYLRKVYSETISLITPFGIGWEKKRRAGKDGLSGSIRILLTPGFTAGRYAKITFDSTYKIPTAAEVALVTDQYENASNTFSLSVMPQFNIKLLFIEGKGGIVFGAQPLGIELISPNRRMIRGGWDFSVHLGLIYDW